MLSAEGHLEELLAVGGISPALLKWDLGKEVIHCIHQVLCFQQQILTDFLKFMYNITYMKMFLVSHVELIIPFLCNY